MSEEDQERILRAENERLRDAIVKARAQLAKGRAFWNGPCHRCDAVLKEALEPSLG